MITKQFKYRWEEAIKASRLNSSYLLHENTQFWAVLRLVHSQSNINNAIYCTQRSVLHTIFYIVHLWTPEHTNMHIIKSIIYIQNCTSWWTNLQNILPFNATLHKTHYCNLNTTNFWTVEHLLGWIFSVIWTGESTTRKCVYVLVYVHMKINMYVLIYVYMKININTTTSATTTTTIGNNNDSYSDTNNLRCVLW